MGPLGGGPPGIIDHNDIIKFMQWKFICKLGIRPEPSIRAVMERGIFLFRDISIVIISWQTIANKKTGIVFLIEQCLFDIVI